MDTTTQIKSDRIGSLLELLADLDARYGVEDGLRNYSIDITQIPGDRLRVNVYNYGVAEVWTLGARWMTLDEGAEITGQPMAAGVYDRQQAEKAAEREALSQRASAAASAVLAARREG